MNLLLKNSSLPRIVPLFGRMWPMVDCATRDESLLPFPFPVWSDEQLVQRLAANDPDALGHIYDRYAPALYRLLCAILESTADAEDALQEVFVALATARAARIRDLRAYLFVTTRHQAITVLRRRKREGHFENVDSLEVPSPETSFVTETVTTQDWGTLLGRLPLEQREVIALKVWEEMTFAQIAQVVRASPNTVMSRYRYGIEKLRQWCQEEDRD